MRESAELVQAVKERLATIDRDALRACATRQVCAATHAHILTFTLTVLKMGTDGHG